MSYRGWEPVIGLEIHAQLKTKSKMFSEDPTEFGVAENQNTSAVSLGLPGALPVTNQKAIEYSVKTGLALNCSIRQISVFCRKNYFYPDLPKGYQISQFDEPICENGFIEFFLGEEKKKVNITRAHMEEDAGKSTHQGQHTLIDLNRAGIPLLEIVSEPDIRSAAEAAEYARTIRSILRYLDVCDGNLEEGSLRCDCNVSVRKEGAKEFGTRVEIKNINSFRFVEKAIDYEIQRQIAALEAKEEITQETRLYDSTKNITSPMRKKEEANDYRYFPDPDLLPAYVSDEQISEIKNSLPELPLQKLERFQKEYKIPVYDCQILIQEKLLGEYFEEVVELCKNPKASSNWIMVELLKKLNADKKDISENPITAAQLAELIILIDRKETSGKIAKNIFVEMWDNPEKFPRKIIEEKGWAQVTDEGAITKMIEDILSENSDQVEQYRGGKTKLFGFFVGQAMKVSKGQANPDTVNKILKSKLDGDSN